MACQKPVPALQEKDVTYGKNPRYKMDIYLCKDREEQTPLVVLIHPGAWSSGDKKILSNMADSLFHKGINVVNINMRYASDVVHLPELMADIDSLHLYLTQQADTLNIRSKNIILGGSSSGAHLALYYSYTHNSKDWIAATFGFATPSNLADTAWLRQVDSLGIKKAVEVLVGESWTIGNTIDSAFYKASIIHNGKPLPTYLFHGDQDQAVPYEQSVALFQSLEAKNIPVQFYTLKGIGHEMGGAYPELFDDIINNLSQWIKAIEK